MQNKIIDFLLSRTDDKSDEQLIKIVNTTNIIIAIFGPLLILLTGYVIGKFIEAVIMLSFMMIVRGRFFKKLHADNAEECTYWSFANYFFGLSALALIDRFDINLTEIIVMCTLMITTTLSHSDGLKEKSERDNKDILIEPLSGEQKKIYDSFIRASLMRDYETEKVQESLSWLEKRNPFYKHVSDLLFGEKLSVAQVAIRTDYSDPQIRRIQDIIISKFDYYIKDL